MIHINRRVIGPIMVPNTPDCDYPNGEELLTKEKAEALKESFKDYNIIDYQHQFTDDTQPYFMQKIGEPVRLFTNDTTMTFEDVTGQNITVPSGTVWLESDITDEQAIKEIDDKELVAYSITVSEKSDAETVMNVYKQLSTKNAQKGSVDTDMLHDVHNRISEKRTLICDIEDPVMLTTSLVKFPCVNKARFCKRSLEPIMYGENMTQKEDNANQTFINSIKEAVNNFRSEKQEEEEEVPVEPVQEEEEPTEPVETPVEPVQEEEEPTEPVETSDKQAIIDEVNNIIDAKLDNAINNITSTIKAHFNDPDGEPNGTSWINQDLTPEGEPITEETTAGTTKGKGGKSTKKEETTTTSTSKDDGSAPLQKAEPSAQKSRQNANNMGGKQKMTFKRDEFAVIKETIQNAMKNKFSTKSVDLNNISYDATGLTTYNRKYLDQLEDPILLNAYKASLTFKDGFTIDETNTRRAILNTNVFIRYVTKIIQDEPLLQDVQYQTGLHGKGHIYDLDDTITTEDGALPEHYYFDKDVAEKQATITNREIETYPQRTKINISDRQRLGNVYGDDLVNILLERTVQRLRRGVAVARFYGNKNAANTVDLQFRRQDGYLKEAGQQLTSDDVNLDKITDIFDTMFYALPEEAQVESDCIFYVPTNVRRAYSSYFLDKAADRAIDFVGQKAPLYWGDAEIKLSPTLNDKPMRDKLDGGNVSVLLIKPNNTHFIVGREAGIEPKRYAETSSDAFYATMDSANAYSINDYAVRLSLTAEEYAGLVNQE